MESDFHFPDYMLSQSRWMVRTVAGAGRSKLPQAAFESPPTNYEPREGEASSKWRYTWTNSTIWAKINDALIYWARHEDTIAGLCYVLHPAGGTTETLRLICLDFDRAITEDGVIDPAVLTLLEKLKTYTELSIGGFGAHAFALVRCKPFKNAIGVPIGDGGATVDILCSSQVAVTGNVLHGWDTLCEVPFAFLEKLQVKSTKDADIRLPDFWSKAYRGLPAVCKYLIEHMQNREACIEGRGGDKRFFKSACYLARYGVTGQEAAELLTYVPQDPPFSEDEIRHKVESAWLATTEQDEFNTERTGSEFGKVASIGGRDPTARDRYGFVPIPLDVLEDMDLDTAFIIDKLFVDREGLFFGGREKTFKTGIAADLAISLATGRPFLNHFDVLDTRRVAFFTAEIGLRAAKSLFGRIRRSKGLSKGSVSSVDIIDELPTFQLDARTNRSIDPDAIAGLRKYFDEKRPEVAIFDPLYLAMTGASVGDMYAIGGALNNMDRICRDFDVWPIFCHHARKDQSREFQPMELGDMYGSGVSAFARQWFLIAHAEPYENGRATLYAKVGGSAAGDCGLWRVSIDEGHSDAILDRMWSVSVENEKDAGEAGEASNEEAVMQALRHFGTLESIQSISTYSERDVAVAKKVLVRLVKAGEITMANNKFSVKGNV